RMTWDEVDHYTFWSSNPNVAYVGGAQAGIAGVIAVVIVAGILAAMRKKGPANRAFAHGRLTLVGPNKNKIAIANTYRNAAGALDRAFSEIHPRLPARQHLSFEPFPIRS